MAKVKAAVWARVSTNTQENENQVLQLEEWARQRRLDVVQV
jgi:predicted site-specific integrase-resolvase